MFDWIVFNVPEGLQGLFSKNGELTFSQNLHRYNFRERGKTQEFVFDWIFLRASMDLPPTKAKCSSLLDPA